MAAAPIQTVRFSDTNVTWTARDFEGNTAVCIWIVKIQNLRPLTIDCPANVSFTMANYTDSRVVDLATLISATTSDPAVLPIYSPTQLQLSEQLGNSGFAVDISAKDDFNNTVHCRTVVNIDVPTCGPWALVGPRNGQANCTYVANVQSSGQPGYECMPYCDAGYVFYTDLQPSVYTCQIGGSFSPSPSVPSCVVPQTAVFSRVMTLTFAHNFASGCLDNVKAYFTKVLNDDIIHSAADGILQECQRIFPTVSLSMNGSVEITSTSSSSINAQFIFGLTSDLEGALSICGNKITSDFELIDTNLATSLSKTHLAGASAAGIDSASCGGCIGTCAISYTGNSFVDETPNGPSSNPKYGFFCPSDFIMQQNANSGYDCASCPPGYYTVNETCAACPAGTYQNQSAQANCLSCPEGTNSPYTANPYVERCFLTCPPGFISTGEGAEGLSPCRPCGANEFWFNATSCSPCPADHVTLNPTLGSPNDGFCKSPCPEGYFSDSGYQPDCAACPLGFYGTQNKTTCDACDVGNTTLATGASNNTFCTDTCTAACANGGQCVIRNNEQECQCAPGYTGTLCETQLDPCASSPCYHGGNCTALDGVNYECACTSTSSEVMKLVELNSDYIQSLVNALNFSSLQECKSYCLGDAVCQAIAFNPNPPVTVPVKFPCVIFSSSTGPLGSQPGYTLYKKASAVAQYWNGSRCENDPMDECETTNCQNGGQCRDMPGYAECLCSTVDIFSGEFCQTAQEVCDKEPCQNGATCQASSNIRRICLCPPGYTGRNCETVRNMCSPDPCNQGAPCRSGMMGNYTCDCPAGFGGPTCIDRPVNPCLSMPCNNGRCVQDYRNNTATCVCNEHFTYNITTMQCVPDDACMPNPCQQGGRCERVGLTDFNCTCPLGYEGSVCQHNIDDCLPNPCSSRDKRATCSDGIGNFTCTCSARYEGKECRDLIELCTVAPPCSPNNTQSCMNLETDEAFNCTCHPGFKGKTCEIPINECYSEPCLHGGTCHDLEADFRCDCAPGWEGKACEHVVGLCTRTTCLNRAPCFNVSRLSYCDCLPGSFGDQCETMPSTCANADPCLNGGLCTESQGRLMCNCTRGYDGQWCEKETDFCAQPGPCRNGGKCHQVQLDYTCDCPPGFTGKDCEVNVDDCQAVTCQNGGVHRDGVGTCDCACPSGFSGPRCATVLPKSYMIDFYGSSSGEYPAFPISQQFFTFSIFIKYATPGATGTFACIYGVTSPDEPLSEGEEIVCLSDSSVSGSNDGQEHFMAILWQGGATAKLFLDSIQNTVNVNMKPTFTHAILVVGSKPNSQFLGELRDINLWNLFLKANISRISDGQDMSGFNAQQVVGKEPPHLTGAARLLIGFRPTPTTKVFPALLPNGCPEDMAVATGSQLSVVANFPAPRFNPATFSTTTSNYASGLPRNVGIFDVQTVAEKGDAYKSCDFNLYVRYGSCENPPAPLGGENPTCDGTALHQGCSAACPPGRAFLMPAPQLFTCGALGVFGREQPRQPFTFPSCGELHSRNLQDVTLTVQYTIRNEMKGATSTPVTDAITNIISSAVRHANNVTEQNGGTSMCDGPCDVTVSAMNTANELTTAIIRLANVSMVVGPGGNWTLEHFLKQQILQDGIFDGTAKPGQSGFTLPDSGLRDISGTLGFSLSTSPNCPPLYQAVGGDCVKCTGGTYYNSSLSRCEPCAVGSYNELDGQESCSPCGNMKTTLGVGASNRTDCVDICPPGTRFNLTDKTCVDCGRGFYQPETGQSLCRPCGVGQTTTVFNATSINDCVAQCEAGQYLTLENTCALCREGLYRRLEDKTCQQCPGSTTTANKGAISPTDCRIRLCAAGQKNVNNTCEPCEIGTYSTTRDAVECDFCGLGNSTVGPGSSSPEACMLYCGNGSFVNMNTSQCETCPPNTYLGGSHSDGFKQSCTACPNGLRTDGDGKMVLSECKFPVCSKGEYVNPDFVEDPQKVGAVRCLACNESSYQPFDDPFNRTCLPCPNLYVTLNTGATSNDSCIPINITRLSASIKLEATCDPSLLIPTSQQQQDLLKALTDTTQADSLTNQVKQSLGNKANNFKGIEVKGIECGSIKVNFDILYVRESDAGQTATDQQVAQAVEALATRQDVIAGLPAIPNTVVVVPKDTVSCAPGEGLNTTTGVAVCEPCPVGTFQYSDIKETCLPCATGYTTSGSGQVWDFVNQPAQDPCRKICPAGQASPDNIVCAPCSTGQFKVTMGIGACTLCPPNTITLQPGANSPDLCIASCDPGFFSTTNQTTGLKECQVCPIGTYSQYRNSLACSQCRSMYTTESDGKTSPADCINVCKAGTYCLNGATCRFDEGEQKPYCDCKIPYEGEKCQRRGVPPAISQNTLIIVAVLGGVGGIMVIAMAVFGTCVLIRRRQRKEPPRSKGSPGSMKDPIMSQGVYDGDGPVYSTSIAPAYYPMGVSYQRRYPVIPVATSRGVSSVNAALPIPRPTVLVPRRPAVLAAPLAAPQSGPQYMFYEDRDDGEYGTVADMGGYSQGQGVLRRGAPQMYQTKTAYFD